MVIKKDYLYWFTNFLMKIVAEMVLLLNHIISLQMNFIGRLLESSRDEKLIHHLETIFGVFI